MDNECFDLCKEVYKRTGWDYEELRTFMEDTFEGADSRGICVLNDSIETSSFKFRCPLYTSDYLLEKLPTNLSDNWLSVGPITNQTKPIHWAASYKRGGLLKLDCWADTPLKALLKLVIALDDAGELNKK